MENEENIQFDKMVQRTRSKAIKAAFGFLGIIFIGLFILAAFINIWAALLGGVCLSFLSYLRVTYKISNMEDKDKLKEIENHLNNFRVAEDTKIALFIKKAAKKKL